MDYARSSGRTNSHPQGLAKRGLPVLALCATVAMALVGCAGQRQIDLNGMPLKQWQKDAMKLYMADLTGNHLLTVDAYPLHGSFYLLDRRVEDGVLICDMVRSSREIPKDMEHAVIDEYRPYYRVKSEQAVRLFQQLYHALARVGEDGKGQAYPREQPGFWFTAAIFTGEEQGWVDTFGTMCVQSIRGQAERWMLMLDEGIPIQDGLIAELAIENLLREDIVGRPEVLVAALLSDFDVYMQAIESNRACKENHPSTSAKSEEGELQATP